MQSETRTAIANERLVDGLWATPYTRGMVRDGRWFSCLATVLMLTVWGTPAAARDAGTQTAAHTAAAHTAAARTATPTVASGETATSAPTAAATNDVPTAPAASAAFGEHTGESVATASEAPAPSATHSRSAAEPAENAAGSPVDPPGRRFERLHAVMQLSKEGAASEGFAERLPRAARRGVRAPTRAQTLGNVTILSNRPAGDAPAPAPHAAGHEPTTQDPTPSAEPVAALRVERHMEASQLTSSLSAGAPAERSSSWSSWLWGMVVVATGLLLPITVLLSRSTRSRR